MQRLLYSMGLVEAEQVFRLLNEVMLKIKLVLAALIIKQLNNFFQSVAETLRVKIF